MLLRSFSAPILSSLPLYYKDSSPEPDSVLYLPRTRSVLSLNQNFSDADLQNPSKPKKKNLMLPSIIHKHQQVNKIKESDEVEEEPQEKTYTKAKPSIQELFSSSGLDKLVVDQEDCGEGNKERKLQTLVTGGGMENNGGRNCGGYNDGSGRGSDDGRGGGRNFSEGNNNGKDKTDSYYQNMIEANPNNALLLGNYAKFLKEVCGNYPKAEEYLERAILANPGDGNVLSLYADLIWRTEKNVDRAEQYFDQAIKSEPDDCYVLASYAKFLWDTEEDEADNDYRNVPDKSHRYPPDLSQGTNHLPSLTATY